MTGSLLRPLERAALGVEQLANRLIGALRLNPFYHTHTLALFLWVVVGATGLVLTLFFQFGFEASYEAVAKMESQPLARVVRAMHKYSSGAAMIVTLLHAYRMFFQGRFRGARWLAWVSGVGMTLILWLGGITGYWLIWDRRAEWITSSLVDLLDRLTPWGAHFAISLLEAEKSDRGWIFMTWLLIAHILLYLMAAGFFWNHVIRLQRPQWWPASPWGLGLTLVLLAISIAFPVGMLPAASSSRLPEETGLDLLYLFVLPAAHTPAAGWLWGLVAVVVAVACAVPWIGSRRRRPPASCIDAERCAGCTLCSVDCPYQAITMVRRESEHDHRLLAQVDPAMCVSCGICLGSCDSHAITLGDLDGDSLVAAVESRLAERRENGEAEVGVVFTCQRHAAHGARGLAGHASPGRAEDGAEIFVLPCVGALPPTAATGAIDAGASQIRVIGCPPGDCAHREGNIWVRQRLTRHRHPWLPRLYAEAPIIIADQPPGTFEAAAPAPPPERGRRPVLAAFGLCAVLLVIQALLSDLPIRPHPDATREALVRVALPDPGRPYGPWLSEPPTARSAAAELLLFLEADSRLLFTERYSNDLLVTGNAAPVYRELRLAPGKYDLRLGYRSDTADASGPLLLFDRTVSLEPGEVLTLDSDRLVSP